MMLPLTATLLFCCTLYVLVADYTWRTTRFRASTVALIGGLLWCLAVSLAVFGMTR